MQRAVLQPEPSNLRLARVNVAWQTSANQAATGRWGTSKPVNGGPLLPQQICFAKLPLSSNTSRQGPKLAPVVSTRLPEELQIQLHGVPYQGLQAGFIWNLRNLELVTCVSLGFVGAGALWPGRVFDPMMTLFDKAACGSGLWRYGEPRPRPISFPIWKAGPKSLAFLCLHSYTNAR